MGEKRVYRCPNCGGTELKIDENGVEMRCTYCSGSLGKTGLKIEGTSYWQVFLVAAGLITLLFVLAVVWKVLFGQP